MNPRFAGLPVLLLTVLPATGASLFPQPGEEARLSTEFHEVSGTLRVIDGDSLMVENFTYDGGGPAVYFYLGESDSPAAFGSGIPIGPLLSGTVFDGSQASFAVDLPAGQTFEGYGAVSVWCVDFQVSFGSGAFAPVPEPAAAGWLGMGAACAMLRRRRR